MINRRQIEFAPLANGPNIARNPLPNHNIPEIGVIFAMEDEIEDVIVAGISNEEEPARIIIRGPPVSPISIRVPPSATIVIPSMSGHSTDNIASRYYTLNPLLWQQA